MVRLENRQSGSEALSPQLRKQQSCGMFNATCSPPLPADRMVAVAEKEQRPASVRAARKL